LRQTWPHIEVIVVDDGSSDDSASIVQHFVERGVKLIRQPRAGASAARNQGFDVSIGEFVQFLDADDVIGPDKISLQMARLLERTACVASSEWGRFYDLPEKAQFVPEPNWEDLCPLDWLALSRAAGLGMLFPAIWLIPRTIAIAAGPWNETLSLGDDCEYFTRIVLAAEQVLFCPGARCYYRSGDCRSLSAQKTSVAWASCFAVTELCQDYILTRESSERMRRGFALSWQHLAHASYPYDPGLARRALVRAKALHDVQIRPQGGTAFHVISFVLGWRAARRLQVASGRP
jgi:glycosyltransferase involved in cell wall biosynthesis